MTSREIRQQFLDFFEKHEHTIVPSAPVVPHDDPTLMFTNAGMNQFKDVFLGLGSRKYSRAADTQKCIRAGGKHNDLDDVGKDTYHHTYFEMLGNWSFGDYFKREAIAWAWELLTEVWGIEKDRLHATYFEGDAEDGLAADDEAASLWREVTDIKPENIHPGNKKDNFWEMGDSGPCGPCSEIHIDLTPDKSGADLVNAGDARVIEIWNLVFIQFNRGADGKLTPLPDKHVDTGMGFERLCAVLQGKKSNYDTDIWTPLFNAIRERTGAPAYTGTLPDVGKKSTANPQVMIDVAYRVIADHLRCLTFALTDGAVPSNEGRGYVLRRILRRAVRYGRQYFNTRDPFLCDLIPHVVQHLAEAFPELNDAHGGRNVEHVVELIRDEEASFIRTLDRGIILFDEAADTATRHHNGRIAGEDAFKLHDTFGFPIDLTELMAEERGLTVDIGEYNRLMEAAKELARAGGASDDKLSPAHALLAALTPATWQFPEDWKPTNDAPKYAGLESTARILGWFKQDNAGHTSPALQQGEVAALVLDSTCFYGEQGGQVGDRGIIQTDTGAFNVEDTRLAGPFVIHTGTVKQGAIEANQQAKLCVDKSRRSPTMKNHTATHLLNWALREVLGDAVQQKGSLVDADRTRFDFSHNKSLDAAQIARVEQLVVEQIKSDHEVCTAEADQAAARKINTLRAVFGEKYPDRVRVVAAGPQVTAMLDAPEDERWLGHAVEFCGGTHVARTGEIEDFAIVAEESVAKGVRRVVAITGDAARAARKRAEDLAGEIGKLSGVSPEELSAKLNDFQQRLTETQLPLTARQDLMTRVVDLQKKVKEAQKQQAAAAGDAVRDRVAELLEAAPTLNGVTLVCGETPGANGDAMRSAVDWVRSKTDSSAVFLASAADDKVTLIAGMTQDVVKKGVKAGDLIKEIAPVVGGRGGGRPDMAQGGGTDTSALPQAVEKARAWLEGKLG